MPRHGQQLDVGALLTVELPSKNNSGFAQRRHKAYWGDSYSEYAGGRRILVVAESSVFACYRP